MKPEDVDAGLVEKAAAQVGRAQAETLENWDFDNPPDIWANLARAALAAVLPEIQAQALEGFRSRVAHSFDHAYDEDIDSRNPEAGHAEGYRHRDRQVRTVLDLYAARLAATTEEKS